jgi:2'-5' RNA ligase
VRWTATEQWHVTLRFLGELGRPDLTRLMTALARTAKELPGPVVAQGGPGTGFLGPGLIVWPVQGLASVATAIEKATTDIGQPVPYRHFLGHLTIARGRRGTDLRLRHDLLADLAGSWSVTSVSLVQSELHPGGAQYRDMETFPVGPCPD